MKFTAACIQLSSQDDIAANARVIESMAREAAGKGAQLICLPENAFLMQEPEKPVPADAEEKITKWCQAWAKELGVWLLAGSFHAPAGEGKSFNRSALINDEGKAVASYDKIHLFDVTLKNGETYRESDRVAPGKRLALAATPWGKLGMSVCYDLRFPHLFRALAKAGADFLAVPSAFTYTTGKAHWHVLLRARAIENGCYVFAPAQCGTHPGARRTYGHSLIVDPWGEVLAEASEDKPEIVYAEIDTEKVRESRMMIPALTHDRNFT